MFQFKNFKKDFVSIRTEEAFKESNFYYTLEILDDIPFSNLFYLNCSEDDNYELFTFIEANGELVEEFDSLQLFDFDEKKIVLYNEFGDIFLFCKQKDALEFSEVF